MSSPFGKAFVIANARAGRATLGKRGERLGELLRSTGLEFELAFTQHAGHAVNLARTAMADGYLFVVAVGGDGTVHEVVNGMMGESGPRNPGAVLGVVPAGSGCDFVRTFGLPANPADAVGYLGGDDVFEIDVGRVTTTLGGEQRSEYFPNIAEAGLGGDVVRWAERLPRAIGRGRYLAGFWLTLGASRPTEGRVIVGSRTYEGRITNLVVANGQFFGGGMWVAPRAHPGDGKFDVQVQIGTKADYVAGIRKVFRGEHIPSPAIKQYQGPRVEVTTERPLQVEADGELLGKTPAVFEIVEKALRLKV